jgi:hypothetical protein
MAESNDTPQRLTLVAVDIAKHYHDVLIEPPAPKRRSRLRLANDLEDFEHLADRKLNCVGCHTPVQRTGQSPADVGAEHLSFVWAPIFSDLLLHKMPVIDAERISQRPRDPLIISRQARKFLNFRWLKLKRSRATCVENATISRP